MSSTLKLILKDEFFLNELGFRFIVSTKFWKSNTLILLLKHLTTTCQKISGSCGGGSFEKWSKSKNLMADAAKMLHLNHFIVHLKNCKLTFYQRLVIIFKEI